MADKRAVSREAQKTTVPHRRWIRQVDEKRLASLSREVSSAGNPVVTMNDEKSTEARVVKKSL